jgi:hypothetical protein
MLCVYSTAALHAAGYFTYLPNYFWDSCGVNDLWERQERKVSSPRVRYYSTEHGSGHKGKFLNSFCNTAQ